MKKAYYIAVLFLALFLGADCFAQLLGSATTNVTIVSDTKVEKAWLRKVVMKDQNGNIKNDDGKVASSAETAAIDTAATNAVRISEASKIAMTNSLAYLENAQRGAATNSVALAMVFTPSTSRTNLTAFLVRSWYNSVDGMDHQYVWYNKNLSLALNRYVVYQTYDRCVTNKCEWVDWTNTVTVVENGRTWSGCRECKVSRPSWAVGERCLDAPNETFGGPNGFDFGDMTLTMGGIELYTGFVTNNVTGEVAYFDNGFFKGMKEE